MLRVWDTTSEALNFRGGGCCDTLTANDFIDPCVVAYAIENHPCDSRVTLTDEGIVQTLNARMGTGRGNVPLVLLQKYSCRQDTQNTTPDSRCSKHPEAIPEAAEKDLLCYAIDSHPMDSRIQIVGDNCPTVANHIVKAGCDGPLVLIRRSE